MIVPCCDLKRQYEQYAPEYEQKVVSVLRSGWYILGKEVAAFEEAFARYLGVKHCVGLASGLDALWISMRLLGIGQGDEVIVCSNAYIACVMGITMNGAAPVFVEPDEYDNLNAGKVERAITGRTKAILAVHLYGQSCDMDALVSIAMRHNLKLIEDCAQNHGGHFGGQTVGTFGDAGCFSFYPTKGLGAFGDGGCLVTNDDQLASDAKMFRNYGSREHYQNEVVGANSRLDELQAGLLQIKLEKLNKINAERVYIAGRYLHELYSPYIALPRVRKGSDSTWHQFVIHTPYRDELMGYLKQHGVGTGIHYPIPPHLSHAYQHLGYKEGDFPIAEKYAKEVLSLPMFNGMTDEEQSYVIGLINAFAPQGGARHE